MLVAPDLDVAPTPSARSLNLVVAHELFHLVQFSYVRAGMPRWIAEGTANALALYGIEPARERIVNSAFSAQTDPRLQQPWTSVFAPGNNCTRCYGGGLWWIYAIAQTRADVPRVYFERLARSRRIGTGWQDLAAAFQRTAGTDFDQVFGRVANRLYRDGFPVRARFTVSAGAAGATPEQEIAGMSTHYVPIQAPVGAQSVEVIVEARGGERFLNRMILGGTAGTDIPWLPQTDRARLVFRVPLTDSTRRELVLVVTNARQRPRATSSRGEGRSLRGLTDIATRQPTIGISLLTRSLVSSAAPRRMRGSSAVRSRASGSSTTACSSQESPPTRATACPPRSSARTRRAVRCPAGCVRWRLRRCEADAYGRSYGSTGSTRSISRSR